MELRPRYGDDPILVLDGPPAAVAAPTIRQRLRLLEVLSGFDEADWDHPTRCEAWSAREVIVHLDSTNAFWSHSIGAGRRGEPSRALAHFDPVASPAAMVAAAGRPTGAEVLERFAASTAVLVGLIESLDDDGWAAPAEAPPGHLSTSAVVYHALWDSWIHERDILVPRGIEPVRESDEIAASLRYAAALSPAFALNEDPTVRGTLAIEVRDPELSIVVEVGTCVVVRDGAVPDADLRLSGDAVELVDALSVRRPIDAEVPADAAWLLRGLATVFDVD
ncbi:MAG: DinB family protein [Actinomycetes bacterium]